MTEMKTWPTTGDGRRYRVESGRDEPSHIHLPRRRRPVRTDAQGTGTTWAADVGSEELRTSGPAAGTEA